MSIDDGPHQATGEAHTTRPTPRPRHVALHGVLVALALEACDDSAVNQSATVALIALAIAGYGVYTALYLPGMLVGPPMPLLVIAFVAQVACGLIAAAALWTHRHWAAVAVGLFAASIVATQLIEVLLGITPYLRAVLIGALAIIGALLLATYTNRSRQAD